MSLSRAPRSAVKSIQSGVTVSGTSTGTTVDIVIGTVNPAKCVCSLRGSVGVPSNNSTTGLVVTGPNNLQLTGIQVSAAISVPWTIVEYF